MKMKRRMLVKEIILQDGTNFEIEFKKTNDDVDNDDDDVDDDCHYKTIQTHIKYELTTLSKQNYLLNTLSFLMDHP